MKRRRTRMTERVDTPFTNEHFAAYCLRMVGQPYWYGTCAYKCTASLLKKKRAQYPAYYLASNESRYQAAIKNKQVASDCIGGVKGYAWTGGGLTVDDAIGTDKTVTSKYGGYGCPDYGATGMFEYARKKGCPHGVIATLPEVPGVALYKPGHAGYYVGDGYAVEWRGTAYGCVKTAVKGRGWTNWYALPFIDYGEADMAGTARDIPLGGRLLQKGSSGEDVRTLQQTLIDLGYDVGSAGADGKFGSNTESAVKAFQSRNGLKVDGKYGSLTHAALMAATTETDDDEEPVEESATEKKVQIVCEDGSVNIRVGNGTGYEKITVAENGAVFPYVATADNGWTAVVVGDKVGWVYEEYSKIE